MTKSEFYHELEAIIEAPSGTIRGDEALRDLEGWSSLAVITFIAMVDEKLGMSVSPESLAKARTVPDLVALFPGSITK
jgi:acyl carrier protein